MVSFTGVFFLSPARFCRSLSASRFVGGMPCPRPCLSRHRKAGASCAADTPTGLGDHLIVQTEDGWQHRHAETGQSWSPPNEDDLTRLLQDAFAFNPDRYGRVVAIDGSQARTDTGVNINIAWDTLAISQNGRDSRWIDRIYSIHYLEWTGFYWTDRILGLGGLALLIYMTYTGALAAFGRPAPASAGKPRCF